MPAFALAPWLARLMLWFGPGAAAVRARLAGHVPAMPSAGTLTVAGVVIGLAVGAWWLASRSGWHAALNIRTETIATTTTALEKAALAAEVKALRAAAKERDLTILMRDLDLAHQAETLTKLEAEQEELRRASANPDAIIIPAGDPWLAGYRPFGVQQRPAPADPVRRASAR